MTVTRRGLLWEILNSWWIILSFCGLSFISFFYIGNKSRTTKWKVTGILYFLVYVVALTCIATLPFGTLSNIAVVVWLASLLIGLIQSFMVRKEYLIRRDYILTNGIEEKDLEEMRKHVKKQYKGKDYIESSGNDTHFDSTYHSNIEYRDYDTVSNKPETNPFEGEYYDESIVKNNEEILDNSKYVSYSKKNKETENISKSNQININFCTVDELLKLPGVNEETAAKAVSLREMLGGFNSVLEFIDMTHIEPQYVDQIREKATIRE